MKPILFNTDMAHAFLEDRKTVTRRVVKPQPEKGAHSPYECVGGRFAFRIGNRACTNQYKPPYHPGDILYVRETWRLVDFDYIDGDWSASVSYKADCGIGPRLRYLPNGSDERCGWRPSIHMPREAARIFLRVTDMRAERLQEITELDILEKEGVTVDFPQPKPSYMSLAYTETRLKPAVRKAFADLWNACYAKPQPVKVEGVIHHYESYPWEDIQETRTYRGKPWYVIGNPWVWVIAFERCEKP